MFNKNSQVEIIDEFTFSECIKLIEFEIPSSVKDLSKNCFSLCNNLVSAVCHDDSRLRSINDFAFFWYKIIKLSNSK